MAFKVTWCDLYESVLWEARAKAWLNAAIAFGFVSAGVGSCIAGQSAISQLNSLTPLFAPKLPPINQGGAVSALILTSSLAVPYVSCCMKCHGMRMQIKIYLQNCRQRSERKKDVEDSVRRFQTRLREEGMPSLPALRQLSQRALGANPGSGE